MKIDVEVVTSSSCWLGLECGDWGTWLSGLGTLSVVLIALIQPLWNSRTRRKQAACALFEDCFTAAQRAVRLVHSAEITSDSLFVEAAELNAMRSMFGDLPADVAQKLNRLHSHLQDSNVVVQQQLDIAADQRRRPPPSTSAVQRFVESIRWNDYSAVLRLAQMAPNIATHALDTAESVAALARDQFRDELKQIHEMRRGLMQREEKLREKAESEPAVPEEPVGAQQAAEAADNPPAA